MERKGDHRWVRRVNTGAATTYKVKSPAARVVVRGRQARAGEVRQTPHTTHTPPRTLGHAEPRLTSISTPSLRIWRTNSARPSDPESKLERIEEQRRPREVWVCRAALPLTTIGKDLWRQPLTLQGKWKNRKTEKERRNKARKNSSNSMGLPHLS